MSFIYLNLSGNICRIDQSIVEECYEFLLLVALASEDGRAKFYEPGVLDLLASHILNLPDGNCFLFSYLFILSLLAFICVL